MSTSQTVCPCGKGYITQKQCLAVSHIGILRNFID